MILACLMNFFFAVIPLTGVTGSGIYARALLNEQNVQVGDPLTLTISFFGDADLTPLHAVRLSSEVGAKWKVDEKSVKTDSTADQKGKELSYRIRPLEAGQYEFPALTFSYEDTRTQTTQMVTTAALPVNVKPGRQIVIEAPPEGEALFPAPDGLIFDLAKSPWHSAERLTADELFAWKRACSQPTEEAFAAFTIPEARLNAAACAWAEGRWARARTIYRRLEWQIGQTESILRGLRAVEAQRTQNPKAQVSAARIFFAPLLQFAWKGRILICLGALIGFGLILFLCRKLVRLFACVLIFFAFASTVQAQDIFEQMKKQFEEMRKDMDRQMEFFSFDSTAGRAPPQITVSGTLSNPTPQVGETFDLILSIDKSKDVTLSDLRFDLILPQEGCVVAGRSSVLTDEVSTNTNNVIQRVSIPLRCDWEYKGPLVCTLSGQYERLLRTKQAAFRESRPFSTKRILAGTLAVKPLPAEGRPDDFFGFIGKNVTLQQVITRPLVATNDVYAVDLHLRYEGHLPWQSLTTVMQANPQRGEVIYRVYQRATGEKLSPAVSLPYYDTELKRYQRAVAVGLTLVYKPSQTEGETAAQAISIDQTKSDSATDVYTFHFAPTEQSQVLGREAGSLENWIVTETRGDWLRVETGHLAGWVQKGRSPHE